MSKRWDVVGVGCNSVDYVYRVPAAPRADSATSKLRISNHQAQCGGQMATAMAACASFGLRAAYAGTIGNDHNGRLVTSELQRRGVDVSHVRTRECPSRFAVIIVDESSGERIVLWDRDAGLSIRADEIGRELVASARVVHVDDEDQDAAIAVAMMARDAGVPVTSDIDRLTDRTRALIGAVTIPIFADHVIQELTGEPDPARGLRALRQPHHQMLCVTLGPSGAALLAGDEIVHRDGFAVTAVDTTGAGDVFRAAFIRALIDNTPASEMLRFANAAAAVSCTKAGAMAGVPSLDEVRALTGG